MTDQTPTPTGGGIDIAQGPQWLVDLLFHSPGWLRSGVYLGVLACLLVALLGLYRSNWTLDDDVQAAMLSNAAVAVGIMLVTTLLTFHTALPYWWDATGGFVGGFASAHVVMRLAASRRVASLAGPTSSQRLTVAWAVVGVAALVPMALAGDGAIPFIRRGGFLLLAVSAVLTVYNAAVGRDSPTAAPA